MANRRAFSKETAGSSLRGASSASRSKTQGRAPLRSA